MPQEGVYSHGPQVYYPHQCQGQYNSYNGNQEMKYQNIPHNNVYAYNEMNEPSNIKHSFNKKSNQQYYYPNQNSNIMPKEYNFAGYHYDYQHNYYPYANGNSCMPINNNPYYYNQYYYPVKENGCMSNSYQHNEYPGARDCEQSENLNYFKHMSNGDVYDWFSMNQNGEDLSNLQGHEHKNLNKDAIRVPGVEFSENFSQF